MVYQPQGQSRWTDTPVRPRPQEGAVIRSRGCCREGYPGQGPRPQAPGSDDARGKLPVPSYLLAISCQGPTSQPQKRKKREHVPQCSAVGTEAAPAQSHA